MARKQYPLRIDPQVWEAVERWAADEMRSSNAQVEWIIRDALRRAGRLPGKGGAGQDEPDAPAVAPAGGPGALAAPEPDAGPRQNR